VLTQRPFPSISRLEGRVDGVGAVSRRRGAVFMITRASMRRASEPRPCRDSVGHAGVPQIVLEFDVTNSYLLTAQITYNRREANNKILAFNSRDLQQRLIDEFNDMKIWDAAGEDHSAMALAIDRRRALEDEEEAEEAEE
jgi:hypothetical protein